MGHLDALIGQVANPLLALLFADALVSIATGQWADAAIVMVIIAASIGIGFTREYQARTAAQTLQEGIQKQAVVLRDGERLVVPAVEVVPGDIGSLSAGSLIPADGRLLETVHFFINESVLTGESFPVEKRFGVVSSSTGLGARDNCVFLGTNVRSGSGTFVVVRTGTVTEYGGIAGRLRLRPPETEFDRSLRDFGQVLAIAMLAMVIIVLTANVLLGRPLLETLLFSIAVAVGLIPELLMAILSVNLARGALSLSQHGVLVRHFSAIENLGSMDSLFTDKTGNLTEGIVRLAGWKSH